MKNSLNKYSLILFFIFILSNNIFSQPKVGGIISNKIFSQPKDEKVIPNKNVFSLHLNEFIFNRAILEYERYIFKYHSIKFIFGYKYSTSDKFTVFKVALYGFPKYYKASNGGYLGLAYKYIIKPRTTFFNPLNELYIMAEFYYSKTSFNNKQYYLCTGMDMETFVKTISMKEEKTGAKIIIGGRFYLNDNDDVKVNSFVDIYGGIGVQDYRNNIFTYNMKTGTCDLDDYEQDLIVYDPPLNDLTDRLRPTFHIGIIFGIDF